MSCVLSLPVGAWSLDTPVLTAPMGTGVIEWVELVARPGSNEIALIYSTSDHELFGLIWDGQSFIEPAHLFETDIWMVRLQSFAAAYEVVRGDLVVVWGNIDNPYWSAKLASGGGFSPKTIHPNVGRWMAGYQLASRPQSNFIAFAGLQCDLSIPCASQSSLHAGLWDGAGWLGGDEIDGSIDDNWGARLGSRAVTTIWTSADEAIAVYPRAATTGLGWAKRYDGTWTDTEGGAPLVSGLSSITGAPFAAAVRE